jgi:hypothetical protein
MEWDLIFYSAKFGKIFYLKTDSLLESFKLSAGVGWYNTEVNSVLVVYITWEIIVLLKCN